MNQDWLEAFPALGTETLSALRRFIDGAFRHFTREHGEALENFFEPLRQFLLLSERLLTQSPWPLVMAGIALVAWLASRSMKIVAGTLLTLLAIGILGMWEDTMKTISMIFVCTVVAIAVGLPVGIVMSRSDRLQRYVNPTLDVMQTMPSFVYLIPVVMLLGIGRVPGLIAVVIYAIPPVIRFTNLGIRLVDKDLLEAADAFGSSGWQRMRQVQLPLALPTIMAGINQTIMLSLSMVVIASMIGVQGLGQPVLKAITNQYFTMGLLNGMAIVGIAIVFDRASQAYGKRLQKHLEVQHG
ncbi:proline/glycine betaine ABC transporter permease [Aquabacterium sp. A08]|uniref:ABC transporter permease n=1 Tax=Aquabacterium sp. A08 TaxID=2718532 RepID=UPI001423F251|nr:proline/glycine betaine ABC transporter permease [Aquabacterium sp. A08]NIC41272.1 proline/glycine betaine ABC transporter permease [Aquabacterium sp. A08]